MQKSLISSLVFVLIFNLLFFNISGIGFGLFFLILNLIFFFCRNKDTKNLSLAISSSVISILFGLLEGFRANEIVRSLNFLASLFFSTAAVYLYKANFNFSYKIFEFITTPIALGISNLKTFFGFLKNDKQINIKNQTTASIIKGVVFALPVIFVLLVLFSNADPIFNKYVGSFLDTISERLLTSSVIFVALFITLMSQHSKRSEVSEQIFDFSHKIYELLIISGSVAILFATFLAIQFRYLFNQVSESELASIGIQSLTYSEYINKGFFELIFASVIASGVIIYTLHFLHNLSKERKLILQIILAILTLEVGLLIFSDFRRLDLYQAAHGLTRAREFGFIFLVWLSLMLGILLITVITKLKSKYFFFSILLITLTTLISLNLFNLDGLIAKKYQPTVNQEIDYLYISTLSSDAHPIWLGVINEAEKTIIELESAPNLTEDHYRKLRYAHLSLENLNGEHSFLIKKYTNLKWQSFNYSEYNASKFITQNEEFFEKVPKLLERVKTLEVNPPKDLKLDRDLNPPLIN